MVRLLTAIGLALLACTPGLAADRIRIGYSSVGSSSTGLWAACDAGLFAKDGLDDQIILIPSGSRLARVAVAGEIDIAPLNGSSATAAALR